MSDRAYWQVKSRLDLAVSDLGATQLKNIAEPVRVYSLEVGKSAQAKPISDRVGAPKNCSIYVPLPRGWLRCSSLLPPAPGISSARNRAAPVGAAHLSIVVLPFTQSLGRSEPGLFCRRHHREPHDRSVAHPQQLRDRAQHRFAFKGKNIDAKEISKELGVRYVLEGSVQRDQNRVRVNAQLIDGETGAHLWADRFEEDVADLFKLQDQVVARLANSLGYELFRAEAEKSTHSGNPTPSISPCAAGPCCGKWDSNL